MRVDLRYLGFVLAVGTAGAAFSACGSEISTATGGAGTGTGGQATTTTTTDTTTTTVTTTTTTTSTTTSTTTTTTSTLTGNSCMQSCALVQQCFGFDGCAMLGIDCNNPVPQGQCIIDCIANAKPDCNTIQGIATACFTTCQNMMMDGGSTFQCLSCVAGPGGQCGAQVGDCMNDPECAQWLQCSGGCYQANPVDPQCFNDCDTQYPNAQSLYDPVYACSCNSCGTECAAGDPCSHVP